MQYEFIMTIPYRNADLFMEKLAVGGYYNTYYDQPINVSKSDNGYEYTVEQEDLVDLHIIIKTESPSNMTKQLADLLNQDPEKIEFNPYELEDWQQAFPRIEVNEEWEIITQQNEPTPGKKQLFLESMGGFGTGAHETTKDCLRVIFNEDFTSKTVMDIGTGSGILSIAAAKMNARRVIAFDVQPSGREVHENARLNAVDYIEVHQKDLIGEEIECGINPDWVFINIGMEETIQILERQQFFNHTVENFLISGLVEWSHEKVIAYFRRNRYEIVQKRMNEEWVTLHFKKGQGG
ncbi:50S ribosomal protein L11 methyltransferase [Pseudalkalibacillus sp. SCS-8]|uniref:50S ribosomal protein L11 methyltransferase n=1 Tax=Pseudalkalibacillus nanhaiensis TaxID=3115291 RepID=UPI0032DAC6F6